MGAFFVAAFCLDPASAAEVDAVFDGDTIKLKDQRVIRIIGINAPELGRKGKASEAYAQASKKRLAELIRNSDLQVSLSYDREIEDRYHRTLAYLTLNNGDDPAEILLREGLATNLVIPPNTSRTIQYAKHEARARHQRLRIWSEPDKQPKLAHELTGKETGYHVIHGKVSSLHSSRFIHWISLDGKLTVKLTRRDAEKYFPTDFTSNLFGQDVEIRGKLYRYANQHRLKLRHPSNIDLFR